MKSTIKIFFLSFLTFAIVSCSSDDDNAPTTPNSVLVNTIWDGQTTDAIIEFFSSTGVSVEVPGNNDPDNLTYTYVDNNGCIIFPNETGCGIEFTIQGSIMSITNTDLGGDDTFIRRN